MKSDLSKRIIVEWGERYKFWEREWVSGWASKDREVPLEIRKKKMTIWEDAEVKGKTVSETSEVCKILPSTEFIREGKKFLYISIIKNWIWIVWT